MKKKVKRARTKVVRPKRGPLFISCLIRDKDTAEGFKEIRDETHQYAGTIMDAMIKFCLKSKSFKIEKLPEQKRWAERRKSTKK